jgi:hypothetical protein
MGIRWGRLARSHRALEPEAWSRPRPKPRRRSGPMRDRRSGSPAYTGPGPHRWQQVATVVLILAGTVLVVGQWAAGEEGPVGGDEVVMKQVGGGRAIPRTTTTGAASSSASSIVPPTTTTAPATTTTTAPPTTTTTAPAPRPAAAATPKKGVSVWEFSGLGAALADVGASWYYNWSPGPTDGAGDSAEFVPMIWGPGAVNDDDLARAQANGTTLLGFNEPDFESQSNMSVDQALDLWPRLEATGLRLGSPAVAVGGADPGGWLDRFMTGARERGLRVDFVTLHWYGGDFGDAAVGQLRSYIEAVHDRYGLPIWLTEYSLIRFDGGGATFPSDAEQAAFVTGSTEMLESLPYVERYAWFALPTPTEGGQGTGLYRDQATPSPTPAGEAYRAAG